MKLFQKSAVKTVQFFHGKRILNSIILENISRAGFKLLIAALLIEQRNNNAPAGK